jgi:hypothetical protein
VQTPPTEHVLPRKKTLKRRNLVVYIFSPYIACYITTWLDPIVTKLQLAGMCMHEATGVACSELIKNSACTIQNWELWEPLATCSSSVVHVICKICSYAEMLISSWTLSLWSESSMLNSAGRKPNVFRFLLGRRRGVSG